MLAVADGKTPEPWERQPGETIKQWAAFQHYRDTQKSKRRLRGPEGQRNGRLEDWSSRFNWQARVLAWDAEQDRVYREEIAEQQVEMARRQMNVARAAQQKIVSWLLDLDPMTLTPHEAARWYEVAVKVERLALGEPERLEIQHHGETLIVQQLGPEETLARLREVQSRINQALA